MLKTLLHIARDGLVSETAPALDPALRTTTQALDARTRALFGRALNVRHVDAGSCNGCELELHAIDNPVYNVAELGIRFVASPRHADLLLVTGPVARHMVTALRRTYDAMPGPKRVVALGDCGCDGGIFGCSYASVGPVSAVLPVDAVVPGCPPSPTRILQGILAALTQGDGGSGQALA